MIINNQMNNPNRDAAFLRTLVQVLEEHKDDPSLLDRLSSATQRRQRMRTAFLRSLQARDPI
jgi:hypothetical protein